MKKLGFGAMRLPQIEADGQRVIDMETTKKMFDAYLAAGFTYFDTAYMYHGGKSETTLRELVVKRYPRDAFTITDKLPLSGKPGADELEGIFNEQLARCGVDYFDYYWLHSVDRQNYEHAEKVGAFGFIQQKKAEGKTKHIGFSYHDTAELLDEILTAHPEVEYVQLQINYLDWEDEKIQSRKCYEVCVKHQKPVIVMEPVKGGNLVKLPDAAKQVFEDLHGGSPASYAIRFAAGFPGILMVLSDMIKQMKDNLLANGYELVDMLGKDYHDGMRVIANFVEDENLPAGKQVITSIIKPQINFNGKMIQSAQIVVSQNI